MQDAILTGDCLDHLARLPANRVDLVFADPPFNIGYGYDVCDDRRTKGDYLAWTSAWLAACYRVMRPGASLYVAIGLEYQAEVKVAMDAAGFTWRDTIAWHYTFGPCQRTKFTPSWVAIHYATVGPGDGLRTWNGEAVRLPSARQLAGDKRAAPGGKTPDNVWVLRPRDYEGCFRPGQNAFLESRVCGTFKERTDHPCQMPEAVLERIIRVSSNPGDLVLDPFAGSGTTLATARKLGRRYLGIELSEEYADAVRRRLAEIPLPSHEEE